MEGTALLEWRMPGPPHVGLKRGYTSRLKVCSCEITFLFFSVPKSPDLQHKLSRTSKFSPTRAGPSTIEWNDAPELSQFLGEMWAHYMTEHYFLSTARVRMVQTLITWRMDTKLFPISHLPPLKKEQPSSRMSVARNVAGAAGSSLGAANQQWRKVIYMLISRLMQLRWSLHS